METGRSKNRPMRMTTIDDFNAIEHFYELWQIVEIPPVVIQLFRRAINDDAPLNFDARVSRSATRNEGCDPGHGRRSRKNSNQPGLIAHDSPLPLLRLRAAECECDHRRL